MVTIPSYLGIAAMPKNKNDILQGTLTLLVLKTLSSQGRKHGYAVTNHIQRVSNDLLRVEEGSLYPALHRLEDEGFIKAEWGTTDTGREARFYSLTAKGRKELAREEENWDRLTEGVRRVMRYA
jgi:PadR family transcriptional regulator, regulatory protein PadR